ncbi:MAG: hypothetical protein COT17_01985 [Elusimicrobia bacterium CG08_land_8_20_14_0_20_51_18]|nr:MAG: hypothetical protein COT17_01985 [Elusimicrobia bacterium CG08_land_8_20_14_0_20_51_18]
MISFLSKHKKIIFIFTVGIFLLAVFFGLGAYVGSGSERGIVAEVGGEKITYERFYTEVNRVMSNLRDSSAEVNEILEKTIKQEVFREMIMEELLYQQARRLKLGVSDFEVAVEVQNTPQFKMEDRFNARAYFQAIWANFKMTPKQYEEWRRKARMGAKFKQFIFMTVKVTPDEIRDYSLSRKAGIKNFEKEKEGYAQKLRQEEFTESANYLLRQITTKMEIKSYLDQIEKGNRQG